MMSHQDDNLSLDEINEAWGEWEEQDITEGSEEWVEDQRNKKKEVSKLVEKRQAKEKEEQSQQLAISLCVEEFQVIVEQIVIEQEKALIEIIEQQENKDLVSVTSGLEHEITEISKHGEVKQLNAETTQDSNETSESNEQKPGQRRNSNHPFFAVQDSTSSVLATREEKSNEQESNLSLSPGNNKK